MNLKEAHKIIEHPEASGNDFELSRAKGYLEAIEQMKPVIQTLEWAVEWAELKFGQKIVPLEEFHGHMRETLQAYRRDVLGEK